MAAAVAGLMLSGGAASASHSTSRCRVAGLPVVVARTPFIVVTRITVDHPDAPRQRFWCAEWRPSGRTTLLDSGEGPTSLAGCSGFDTCAFAAQVRVAGRYVAYIYREPDPQYNDGIDTISELDSRAGTQVVSGDNDPSLSTGETSYVGGNGQAAFGGITKLALNRRGDVAWIVNNPPDSAAAGSSAVYEHRPGQRTLVLETASFGAIGQLAITAAGITWTDNGIPHAVSS